MIDALYRAIRYFDEKHSFFGKGIKNTAYLYGLIMCRQIVLRLG
jgi:hypothetical protein